ncbi:MAG: NAD(P)H-dependent oxidoreductase [Bacteroidetes bacterium]|nr:NAD(P)H-dependent oxidoreductase [Bacteroidota bacterium]
MITIISATNRPQSNTLKIAQNYAQLIEKQGVETKLFSLEQLPADFIITDLYNKRSENFQQLLNEFIIPVEKFVFVVPEYNGSFPGVLKTFLDAVHPDTNRGKKVALVGVATGRAGNLRGMDHLTGILHYLGMHILPNKQPISSVLALLNADGSLKDENTIKALEKQIGEFVKW